MEQKTKQIAVATAGIAVGLAALTAAGYFVFGPNGKKNRIKIRGWTLRMKGEILERMEKVKELNPEVYNAIIDEVSAKYGKLKYISAIELATLVTDLKKHWSAISRDMHAQGTTGRRRSVAGGAKKKTIRKRAAAKKKTAVTSMPGGV